MSDYGKSIRIFLKDGTVSGIRFGEIVNQTIQCFSCPRNRILELSSYPEIKKPGVYFLFGFEDETNDAKVYIGEAENIFDRLQYHVANKEFWSELIFFSSKDENLTKAHVRYLESRTIQLAMRAKRYKIENANQSSPASLPLPDKDAMEEYLTYLKLLLGTFGHKLLEEVAPLPMVINSNIDNNYSSEASSETLELSLNVSGLKAKALQTDEGIVVLKDSEAALDFTSNLSPGYQRLRNKLIEEGTLRLTGNKYIFQKDELFKNASPAAAVIVGYNINGLANWKDKTGRTLKQIENEKLESSV
jgi:hypothetical protein